MKRRPLRLDSAAFDKAFPFHLAVNREMELVSVGASIPKLLGEEVEGKLLPELVVLRRPGVEFTFEELLRHVDQLFILEARTVDNVEFRFRGQLVFSEEEDCLVFLISPWLESHALIGKLGLSLDDFALHDGSADLIHLFRIQTSSLEETKSLAARLKETNVRLKNQFQALAESEAQTGAIVSTAVDGIIVIDDHGSIQLFNPAAEAIFGHRQSEVLGKNVSVLMTSPHREQHDDYMLRYLETGEARIIGTGREVTALRKNGEEFPCELSISEASVGDTRRFVGIVRDISDRKRFERELVDTSTRLSTLIRRLHAGVLVENEQRRIAIVNTAFCDLFGIDAPPEALVGADCAATAAQASQLFVDSEGFLRGIERVLAQRELETGVVLETIDGRVLTRDYVPIFVNDDYRGHLWQYRDVTAQKLYEAEILARENRKSAILQTALDAIITIDQHGRIVEWNPAAEEIFGWSFDEARGQLMSKMIIPPHLREAHMNGFEHHLRTGEGRILGVRIQWTGLRKSGEEFPCEFAVTKIPSPDGPLFTGFLRDISDRIEAEKNLREATQMAEKANRAKTDFLATMSHEIRTPLNAMLGMGELLAETKLDHEQTEFLRTITSSGEALLSLMNDFLDLSKIEAGQLDIDAAPFNPVELAEEVVSILRPRSEARSINLGLKCRHKKRFELIGDPQRIRQVLLNLTANAIKFTERGGVEVEVEIEPGESETVQLRYRVRDTGIGIPPEEHERVFERFRQVDSSITRRFGGTGLGLSICRSLAETMGGRVWLENSVVKQGSEFCFEVGLIRVASRIVERPRSGPIDLTESIDASLRIQPSRILLGEDNPDNRRITQRILEAAGHSVDTASDGEEVLRRFDRSRYDLVLLDVEMPVMDGIEATRRIRASEIGQKLPPVPIVALTAHALEETRRRCIEAGMNDYLTKPTRKSVLLAAVETWLDFRPAILVVDDSSDSLEVTRRFIDGAERFRACWANGVERAMVILSHAKIAGVILDIEMPGFSGFEAIPVIRKRFGSILPIIALSGHTDQKTRARCLDAGCSEYLTKPVSRETLLNTIEQHIGGEPDPVARDAIVVRVDPDIDDLVEEFLESRRHELARMPGLLEEGEFDALRIIGHNLKGTSGAYGFPRLGAIGAALEQAARSSDPGEVEKHLAEFKDYLERLVLEP